MTKAWETIKSLIVPFLIGGGVIAGVKFAATHLANPMLAAAIGGIPTGIIAIFFLKSTETVGYSSNYFFVNLILATSTLLFIILNTRFKVHKNIATPVALVLWLVLVLARYFYRVKVGGESTETKH
jgi:hypothetical protein